MLALQEIRSGPLKDHQLFTQKLLLGLNHNVSGVDNSAEYLCVQGSLAYDTNYGVEYSKTHISISLGRDMVQVASRVAS